MNTKLVLGLLASAVAVAWGTAPAEEADIGPMVLDDDDVAVLCRRMAPVSMDDGAGRSFPDAAQQPPWDGRRSAGTALR